MHTRTNTFSAHEQRDSLARLIWQAQDELAAGPTTPRRRALQVALVILEGELWELCESDSDESQFVVFEYYIQQNHPVNFDERSAA
jgi:hypothetical protein